MNNEKLKQHAHQRLEDFKTHKKQQGQELAQTLEQELREYRAKLKYQAERSTQKNLEHIAKTITTSNKEARTRYLAALEKAETDHPLIKERREEMALKIYLGIIKTNQTLLDNLKREFGIE